MAFFFSLSVFPACRVCWPWMMGEEDGNKRRRGEEEEQEIKKERRNSSEAKEIDEREEFFGFWNVELPFFKMLG